MSICGWFSQYSTAATVLAMFLHLLGDTLFCFINILFILFFFPLVKLRCLWDLSSRDWTQALVVKVPLDTKEFPVLSCISTPSWSVLSGTLKLPFLFNSYRGIVSLYYWQPTPVLLPGNSHGQRSLVGYSLWGHKESDTTEWLHFSLSLQFI